MMGCGFSIARAIKLAGFAGGFFDRLRCRGSSARLRDAFARISAGPPRDTQMMVVFATVSCGRDPPVSSDR